MMARRYLQLIAIACAVAVASCGGSDPVGPTNDVLPSGHDEDGDGITDVDEGRHEPGGAIDTDGDTIPDWQDEDSDNDTIPDSCEAGFLHQVENPPADSDLDGADDTVTFPGDKLR